MPTFIHGHGERTAELTNTNLLTWGAPAKCVREAGKGDKVQGLSELTGNQAGVRRVRASPQLQRDQGHGSLTLRMKMAGNMKTRRVEQGNYKGRKKHAGKNQHAIETSETEQAPLRWLPHRRCAALHQ